MFFTDPPYGILKDSNGNIRYEDQIDKQLRKSTIECFNKCSKKDCTVALACTLDSVYLWKKEFLKSGWTHWCTIISHPTKYSRGKIYTNKLFEVIHLYVYVYIYIHTYCIHTRICVCTRNYFMYILIYFHTSSYIHILT